MRGYSKQRTGNERMMEDRIRRNAPADVVPDDPRLDAAQKELGMRLADYREKNPALHRDTYRAMKKIAEDFRITCAHKGLKLPKLAIVVFLKMDHVCIWPQDMEHTELQKRIHMFIVHRQRHGRPVDANDIAMGVRRAYPDYSPSRSNLILPASFKTPSQQETAQ